MKPKQDTAALDPLNEGPPISRGELLDVGQALPARPPSTRPPDISGGTGVGGDPRHGDGGVTPSTKAPRYLGGKLEDVRQPRQRSAPSTKAPRYLGGNGTPSAAPPRIAGPSTKAPRYLGGNPRWPPTTPGVSTDPSTKAPRHLGGNRHPVCVSGPVRPPSTKAPRHLGGNGRVDSSALTRRVHRPSTKAPRHLGGNLRRPAMNLTFVAPSTKAPRHLGGNLRPAGTGRLPRPAALNEGPPTSRGEPTPA